MPGREPQGRTARLAQGRSRERRQRLLDAAITLLVTEGRGSITHRSVAKEADVSMSSVGYYFPTIDELVTEAVTDYIDRWRTMFDELASTPGTTIEDVMSTFGTLIGDVSREERLKAWQIYVQAVREPATTEAMGVILESIRTAFATVFAGPGRDERLPDLVMVALVGTSLLALGRADSGEQMVQALSSAVEAFVETSDPLAQSLRATLESFEGE